MNAVKGIENKNGISPNRRRLLSLGCWNAVSRSS